MVSGFAVSRFDPDPALRQHAPARTNSHHAPSGGHRAWARLHLDAGPVGGRRSSAAAPILVGGASRGARRCAAGLLACRRLCALEVTAPDMARGPGHRRRRAGGLGARRDSRGPARPPRAGRAYLVGGCLALAGGDGGGRDRQRVARVSVGRWVVSGHARTDQAERRRVRQQRSGRSRRRPLARVAEAAGVPTSQH